MLLYVVDCRSMLLSKRVDKRVDLLSLSQSLYCLHHRTNVHMICVRTGVDLLSVPEVCGSDVRAEVRCGDRIECPSPGV